MPSGKFNRVQIMYKTLYCLTPTSTDKNCKMQGCSYHKHHSIVISLRIFEQGVEGPRANQASTRIDKHSQAFKLTKPGKTCLANGPTVYYKSIFCGALLLYPKHRIPRFWFAFLFPMGNSKITHFSVRMWSLLLGTSGPLKGSWGPWRTQRTSG